MHNMFHHSHHIYIYARSDNHIYFSVKHSLSQLKLQVKSTFIFKTVHSKSPTDEKKKTV